MNVPPTHVGDIGTPTPGPARVLILATVVIPGDQAMPLADFEAYVAQALRNGGVHPVRVNAEFIEAVNA